MQRSKKDQVGTSIDRAVIVALDLPTETRREALAKYNECFDLDLVKSFIKDKLKTDDDLKMKALVVEEQKRKKELKQNEICL